MRRHKIYDEPPYRLGKAELGHGMCSGNFILQYGATYKIQVRVIDQAGNTSPPSTPLTVTVRGGMRP